MTHLTVERTLNRYAGRFTYIGKPPVAQNDTHRRHRCPSCARTACSCSEAGK